MPDFPEPLVREMFASPYVDEGLFGTFVGGAKSDSDAVSRYLNLPLAQRPEVSWFFDREFYWQRYPDMAAVDIDPLVHFIGWGVAETRTPHPMIDIKFIQVMDPNLLPDPPTIAALHDLLLRDLIDPGPLFSLEFYRRQLDGSETVEGGLLRHFLEVGLLRGLKPSPDFDPISYYRQMDRKTYDIRSSLRHRALTRDLPQDASAEPLAEGQTKALFRAKAEFGQLFRKHNPIRFDFSGTPDVSVIMVVHDNFALTLQSLSSLRTNYAGPIELILIDSGSTDETQNLTQYVTGACLFRFESNIGFVRGCNAGLEVATAEAVLYLNNDLDLAEGAIEAARRRLLSNEHIGAVGAKVVRTHGLLQEAGCIIWQDGWSSGYQRDKSPLTPEANFVRDVDFCSAVFLLCRGTLLRTLGGFDDAFAPAYFEDTDLCVRIREAGYRIVYDPSVTVYHLEYGTSERAAVAHERIQDAHQIFVEKHRKRLRLAYTSDIRAQLVARSVGEPRGRVLFIEDRLPLRRLGSGFVRSNDIVCVMAELGFQVSVYPLHRNDQNLTAVYADFPDTVEVLHDRERGDLEQFLKLRRGYYNTIWIARNHNLDIVRPVMEQCGVDVIGGVRIVLDTEALATNRETAADPEQALQTEMRNASFCQTVLAVNSREAEQISALGLPDVRILGHVRPVRLTPRSWQQRAGMLFVGAIHTLDSPNYDSLCWFVDAVLPLVEQQLGYETRLTIAGFAAEGIDLGRFIDHPRISLRGAVADLTPLYDGHRVFVAPTRVAAGLPYKVHEAASYGLPVVATELLRQQLGWTDGRDLLAVDAADPEGFAARVVALYRSEALWSAIRVGGAERVKVECGMDGFRKVIEGILG